jgi:TonB-dependent Receptor Plug Domain
MKKILLLAIILLIIIPMYAKEVSLSIRDKDIDIPLEAVKVLDKASKKTFLTDKNGKIKFSINDSIDRVIVSISLVGYESKTINIKDFNKEILVQMVIAGVLEGKELVVEGKDQGKNDQVGVSKVIDKENLKSNSERGIIEDVFASLRNLPGVTYAGRFSTNLSVRGGDPSESATVYDGFLIRYPFQWGGAVSIFDPNVVESVTFSPGIFNARYGYATSGIFEIDSYKPEKGPHLNTGVATAAFDAYLQTPLGLQDAGLLLGTRIAYTDLVNVLNNVINSNTGLSFTIAPYIRNAYLKWYWKPTNRIEWYVNGFFGTDGTETTFSGQNMADISTHIVNNFKVNYYNIDTFGVTGVKLLPNDNIHLEFMAGYEYLLNSTNLQLDTFGSTSYSDDFIAKYGALLGSNTSYTIDDLNSNIIINNTLHSIQTRFDADIKLNDKISMSAGLGGFYDFHFYQGAGKIWQTVYQSSGPVFERVNFTISSENKQFLKYFGYLSFNFNIIPEIFEIETGIRVDHLFLYAESFNNGTLNFYPAPGPRLLIKYSPVRNLVWLDKLTFSTGVGLFSKMPLTDENSLSGDFNIKDFQIPIPQVLEAIIGTEFKFPFGFNFKIEGYYKYSYNRFYVNSTVSSTGDTMNYIHSDGIAHIAGVEVSLDRKLSRFIDGTISYSFIYARYYNPQTESDTTRALTQGGIGDPTGIWYYPSFHQFHTLNIELNIRPVSFCVITPSFRLASGTPKSDYGNVDMFPAHLPDGTIVELYSRQQIYSDVLRNNLDIPFNLKISFNLFFPKTHVSFEIYAAVEDLFAFIYTPANLTAFNQYSGKDEPSTAASFAFKTPQPSAGIRVTF